MITISIPITTELNKFIKDILEAQQEIRDGKGLRGDLDELAKGFE